MTLREAKTGMLLKIKSIADFALKDRLMTMGLLPGTTVKVLQSSIFGDPMALRIRSYDLAIRRADAENIQVEEVR